MHERAYFYCRLVLKRVVGEDTGPRELGRVLFDGDINQPRGKNTTER